MSTEPINNILGYYGKVPTQGDFISKGLPRSFIEPWDIWLQEAIFTSQQQLGSRWLEYYLTSPIYHFILAPGICGNTGWLGILMPSVDKIGRYYPMTIALMLDASINPFVAIQKQHWFDNLEQLALSCLHEGYRIDDFNQDLERLRQKPICQPTHTSSAMQALYSQGYYRAWQQTMVDEEPITNIFTSMLDSVVKEQCFAYSLWLTQGSEVVQPSFLFSEGLPPFDGMAALFDGNWQQWGWHGNRYPILLDVNKDADKNG
jgi:type VI secretion system protein ImpM